MNPLRLRIDPVIRNAEDVRSRVEREIPHHTGLMSLAGGVAAAAGEAKHVAERLRRPFGIHRLPALFLVAALLMLVVWIYIHFFRTYTLTIALPDRDAHELNERAKRVDRLELKPVFVPGSPEAAKLVEQGKVDLAFVQGGIEIESGLPRLETPDPEVVLWFVRSSVTDLQSVRRVLTSVEGAGSHSVAKQFMKAWKIEKQITYLHDWVELSGNEKYVIPNDVDAAFAVKDLSDEKTLQAVDRLANAGFRLASPDLGARLAHLDYLKPMVIPAGFLRSVPPFPTEATATYSVATYLVANRALTARMLAAARHLLDGKAVSITDGQYEPTLGETSEFLQGIDAFLGIIINLVLAFLALTGLEMLAYRKRFHELNSLVSLISIHQSSKDVLGIKDEAIRHDHLLYLSLCSDLLGLVSMIGGYYTQENSSLLFSGMPEIIHQRCDGLKINIQLKILHATIKTEPVDPKPIVPASLKLPEPPA